MPAPGSSRPPRAPRTIPTCGPSCARRDCTTRRCWPGWPSRAWTSTPPATGRAGSSPSACAARRTPGSVRSRTWCCAGRPATWPRSRRRRRASCSRRSGRCTAALHAPGSARVDGRGMAAALREGAAARGVAIVAGAVHGVVASAGTRGGGTRRVEAVAVEGHRNVECDALGGGRGRLDGGHGGVARADAAGGTDEGPDRAPGGGRRDGRLAHRATAADPLSRALARRTGGLWRHLRDRCGLLRRRDGGRPARALARVPLGGTGPGERHLPRDPRRSAPDIGRRPRAGGRAARAGSTRGWRRATVPTGSCRGRTRPGSSPTRWQGSRFRPTRCRSPWASRRRASAERAARSTPGPPRVHPVRSHRGRLGSC